MPRPHTLLSTATKGIFRGFLTELACAHLLLVSQEKAHLTCSFAGICMWNLDWVISPLWALITSPSTWGFTTTQLLPLTSTSHHSIISSSVKLGQ